jgi:hypothetical protein
MRTKEVINNYLKDEYKSLEMKIRVLERQKYLNTDVENKIALSIEIPFSVNQDK